MSRARKYVPEEAKLARVLSSYGITTDDIANELSMGKATMYKLYRDDLAEGQRKARIAIGKRLFKLAMDGNAAACIFLAKVRLGMREIQRVDHTSSDGTMSPKAAAVDPSLFTPEQILALRGLSERGGEEQ